jgi:hypothetical protein
VHRLAEDKGDALYDNTSFTEVISEKNQNEVSKIYDPVGFQRIIVLCWTSNTPQAGEGGADQAVIAAKACQGASVYHRTTHPKM